MEQNFTPVENAFFEEAGSKEISTRISYLTTESFPKLGLLSALSFLEWVAQNPEGVVSLPTGKTAQYFIDFTHLLLDNWNNKKGKDLLDKYGMTGVKKPELKGLTFVQMGEFYPINPEQHNSLCNNAIRQYINGLGFDGEKALLINSDKIELADGKHFSEIFPNYIIDLSLRFREAKSNLEKLQKESIFKIDNWCTEYENKIREKGGIGFFLGGIGPDGHIAFNTRGSDHFSTTRL